MSNQHNEYGIPLSNGKHAAILAPFGMSKDDVQKLRDWIDLCEDALTGDEQKEPKYFEPRATQIGDTK